MNVCRNICIQLKQKLCGQSEVFTETNICRTSCCTDELREQMSFTQICSCSRHRPLSVTKLQSAPTGLIWPGSAPQAAPTHLHPALLLYFVKVNPVHQHLSDHTEILTFKMKCLYFICGQWCCLSTSTQEQFWGVCTLYSTTLHYITLHYITLHYITLLCRMQQSHCCTLLI